MLKLRCKRGHRLTPDNLYIYGNKRMCKICAQLRAVTRIRKSHLATLTRNGYCKREHELNETGWCSTCAAMLYEARIKLEDRRNTDLTPAEVLERSVTKNTNESNQ